MGTPKISINDTVKKLLTKEIRANHGYGGNVFQGQGLKNCGHARVRVGIVHAKDL